MVACLLLVQPAFADDHDNASGPAPSESRPSAPGMTDSSDGDCGVSPKALARFANGEKYDFRTLVTFLTSAPCRASSSPIRLSAIYNGIDFNSNAPYKLDMFTAGPTSFDIFHRQSAAGLGNLEKLKEVDNQLASSIPATLREYPLSPKESLPILGQLAVLSPDGARAALANMIDQELITGDIGLERVRLADQPELAQDLGKELLKMGANTNVMASQVADSVEDMALLAQADSLGKLLPALAMVATAQSGLVPTFNLSAAAVNRGVQRGKSNFDPQVRDSLIRSIFRGVKAAIAGSANLDPGAADLNEALTALMNGQPVSVATMGKMWRDALQILIDTNNQSALADAVGMSLTPEIIYLSPVDIKRLLTATANYPRLAMDLQRNFLAGWDQSWESLKQNRLKLEQFNQLRHRFFEPMVESILSLDPRLIDPFWLRKVLSYGLIRDEQIEKRFPGFVLAFLQRRDQAVRGAVKEAGFGNEIGAMTQSFSVLWTLSNVHLPALMKWVKKYDQ